MPASANPLWADHRRENKLREWAEWLMEVECDFEDLPADAFKLSGTMVNTFLVKITKAPQMDMFRKDAS
jgi:hypothetical protein